MKISGVGLEPHECNDEFLSKRLGLDKAVLIIEGIFVGLIALVGLIFFIDQVSTYGFENAFFYLLAIIAFGLIFGIPGFFIFREARAIQEELDKRSREDEDDARYIEEITRKNTRRSLIVSCCVIALVVIIIFKVIGGAIGGSSTRCVECGKRGNYSQGFCYSCYKDVYDHIKENGR